MKAGAAYFGIVFAAGFVLGTLRILLLVPRIGTRAAELIETPLMVLVTVIAARWVISRFSVCDRLSVRLGIGISALILLLAAEVGVGVVLRGMSLGEMITNRDPVSGTAYGLSLVLFGLMPALVRRDHGRHASV